MFRAFLYTQQLISLLISRELLCEILGADLNNGWPVELDSTLLTIPMASCRSLLTLEKYLSICLQCNADWLLIVIAALADTLRLQPSQTLSDHKLYGNEV